jgi:hypothetical protein
MAVLAHALLVIIRIVLLALLVIIRMVLLAPVLRLLPLVISLNALL